MRSKYNSTYNRTLTLPSHYRFGDPFFGTDFGLSKKFTYKERARLTVAGEVFNAFNIANLQLAEYNFLLGTPTFGQATTRIIQTFVRAGRARSRCWRESASKPGGTILTSSPRQRP